MDPELPEDLDVCIAQRDFEGAVDLLDKLNHYLEDKPSPPPVKELRAGRMACPPAPNC